METLAKHRKLWAQEAGTGSVSSVVQLLVYESFEKMTRRTRLYRPFCASNGVYRNWIFDSSSMGFSKYSSKRSSRRGQTLTTTSQSTGYTNNLLKGKFNCWVDTRVNDIFKLSFPPWSSWYLRKFTRTGINKTAKLLLRFRGGCSFGWINLQLLIPEFRS